MTLQELLENSNLAALGLLDPEDHAQFERALSAAPPRVRLQVISEQARWAESGALLPDVTAPAALRDRVLDGVRNAIVEASINSDDFSLLREQHGIGPRKVSASWRAASMGLMAAVFVLGGAFLYVYQTNVNSANSIGGNKIVTEYASKFEGEFEDVIFGASTKHIIFDRVDESFAGEVALFTNPDWMHARVISRNLPRVAGEEYRIVEVDAEDKIVRTLGPLQTGVQTNADHPLPRLASGTKLAIVRVPVGSREASATVLMTATVA